MSRLTAIFLTLISLGFVGAGIFILSREPSEPTGWMAVLFFGGCGLIGLIELIGYSRKDVSEVLEDSCLVVRRSRTHGIVYSLASLGMASGGLILGIFDRIPWFWSAVGIALFGVGGLIMLIVTLLNRPLLSIDTSGIAWQGKFVPWDQIAGYSVASINGNDCLCLTLRDPDYLKPQLSSFGKKLARLNASAGFGDAFIPLSGINVKTDQILAIFDEHVYLLTTSTEEDV